MRNFTEVSKKPNSIMVEFSFDEAQIISLAMTEFCERNKRMQKAKRLLKEIDQKFEIY